MKTFITIILLAFPLLLTAQSDSQLLNNLIEQNRNSIGALALYPDETRNAILEASQYPEALVRISTLQSNTSVAFKNMLDGLNQEKQGDIFELGRYPELITELTQGGKKNKKQLDEILGRYPEEIRQTASALATKDYDLLVQMDNLGKSSNETFENIISGYSTKTQDAFRALIQLPEVINILIDDMNMTVLVGDLYNKNPDQVIATLDSLNLVLANENAQELEDWKKSLENDPEAKKELEQAAAEYAEESGYTEAEYTTVQKEVIINNYYYDWRPYYYWYGWPWWYTTPYWYPYPYWYDWGFYYGPGGTIVVFGLPSWHFCHWYYYHPYHHHHYPHFSSHMADHYYGHRTSTSGVVESTGYWKNDNSDGIDKNWTATAENRVERFKEYGQLSQDVKDFQKANPTKEVSRYDYLKNNKSNYPSLDKAIDGKKINTDKNNGQPDYYWQMPEKKPIEKTPSQKTETPAKPKWNYDRNKVNKASDYHKKTWENNKTITKPKTTTTPKVSTPKNNKVKPKVAPQKRKN